MALTTDLEVFYSCENDATDETGSYNATFNGTYSGTAKIGSYAASFDGSNDVFNTGYALTNFNSDFTLNFWQKNSYGASATTLWAWFGESGNGGYYFNSYARKSDNLWGVGTLGSGSNFQGNVTAASIDSTDWTMITITRDGNDIKMYINADEEVTGTASTISEAITETLVFGRRKTGSSLWFTGLMDLMSIHSRALSSTEVSELYNSGDGLSYDDLDGGSTPAADSSGLFHGNNF